MDADGANRAGLNEAFVDEEKRIFFVRRPEGQDVPPVTLDFASSMLGQLLRGSELIAALQKLGTQYSAQPDPGSQRSPTDTK
jgi:hypothetical protein